VVILAEIVQVSVSAQASANALTLLILVVIVQRSRFALNREIVQVSPNALILEIVPRSESVLNREIVRALESALTLEIVRALENARASGNVQILRILVAIAQVSENVRALVAVIRPAAKSSFAKKADKTPLHCFCLITAVFMKKIRIGLTRLTLDARSYSNCLVAT
jgi:hypothetical protein